MGYRVGSKTVEAKDIQDFPFYLCFFFSSFIQPFSIYIYIHTFVYTTPPKKHIADEGHFRYRHIFFLLKRDKIENKPISFNRKIFSNTYSHFYFSSIYKIYIHTISFVNCFLENNQNQISLSQK